MDKMTFISQVWQVPAGHSIDVRVKGEQRPSREFHSPECVMVWCEEYPEILADVNLVVFTKKGAFDCWHCSRMVCTEIARNAAGRDK